MSIAVKVRNVKNLRYYLDDNKSFGVEISIEPRRLYNYCELYTINKVGMANAITTFKIPDILAKRLMKPVVNRAFNRIKYRLIEWGFDEDITFPWKDTE